MEPYSKIYHCPSCYATSFIFYPVDIKHTTC